MTDEERAAFYQSHGVPDVDEARAEGLYRADIAAAVTPLAPSDWNGLVKPFVVDDEAQAGDLVCRCGGLTCLLSTEHGKNNLAIYATEKAGAFETALALLQCIYWLVFQGVYIFRFARRRNKYWRMLKPFDCITVKEYNLALGYEEDVTYLLTTRRNHVMIAKIIDDLRGGRIPDEFV